MPRRMQVEFSAVVQRHTDASETEMGAAQLWGTGFQATYLRAPWPHPPWCATPTGWTKTARALSWT